MRSMMLLHACKWSSLPSRRTRFLLFLPLALVLTLAEVASGQTPIFDPPIVHDAGVWSYPYAVDLDGDGVVDLVSLDRYGHALSTWIGAGDGTFTMLSLVTLVYEPNDVAIADLDGDADLDLAVAMFHPNNHIQVLFGDGSGHFSASLSPFYANPSLNSIAWGHFDQGSTVDLVVTESTTGNSKAHFFAGNGDGTFTDLGAYFIGDRTGTIEVWDFDLDGFQDAAVSLTNGNGVRVLYGNGLGQFTVGPLHQPPTTPYLGPIDRADLDLDGDMDLVGVNNNSHSWAVFLNTGNRTFSVTSAPIPGSTYPGTVTTGDFTGDGIPDVAFGDYGQGLVIVYAGDGAGGIMELTPRYGGSGAGVGTAADFDGDGAIDLAVGDGNGNISVFLNRLGPETFSLSSTKDTTLRKGARDRNEGGNGKARIRESGNNRMAVSFDLSGLSVSGLLSARVELSIHPDDPPSQWGSQGRYLECLPLLENWVEGNGKDLDLPPAESDRGTGVGATWNCAADSDISDQASDCVDEWVGAELGWGTKTAADQLIVNDQAGIVSFDVTLDVQDALSGMDWDGWVVKKVLEGATGNVRFYTKEGAAAAGDPALAPRLVLEYAGGLLARGSNGPVPATDPWEGGAESVRSHLLVESASPNPFLESVSLELRSPDGTPVSVLVLDVNGRRVRNLGSSESAGDTQRIVWDGRDDQGRRATSGVYFLRLRSGSIEDRVTVVRK